MLPVSVLIKRIVVSLQAMSPFFAGGIPKQRILSVKQLNWWMISALMLLLSLTSPTVGSSDGVDLHRLWDDRCYECHGHAADFLRRVLSAVDGELQGAHHVDGLRKFMQSHYLNLDLSEVNLFYEMLLAQASTQPRYAQECIACHGSVADFVRESLELCTDMLCRRNSGRPVRSFLDTHRSLDSKDVDFYMELLTRVAHEVF